VGFPDTPVFQFFHWLVNTPGLGGLVVGFIVIVSVGAVGSALSWIVAGAQVDELETYAHPTPALHHFELYE
jgi:hypothetical protein